MKVTVCVNEEGRLTEKTMELNGKRWGTEAGQGNSILFFNYGYMLTLCGVTQLPDSLTHTHGFKLFHEQSLVCLCCLLFSLPGH